MYINTKILEHYKLSLTTFSVLCLLRQNKFEDQSKILESYNGDLDILNGLGCLEEVKAKNKKQNPFERVRCTQKGQEIIDNVSTAEIDEDSLKIFEWVKSIYLNSSKEIGNSKKCKQYVAQFSKESGIVRNCLAYLIQTFLNDEKEFEFSQRMEYLFFKGSSVFSVRFDINQSRLFQYYQKHQLQFDNKFKEIGGE